MLTKLKECFINFFKKFISIIMYAGLDRAEYNRIRPLLAEDSRKRLKIIVVIGAFTAIFLVSLSFFFPDVIFAGNQEKYISLFFALIVSYLFLAVKNNIWITYFGELIFLASCMLFGISLGITDAVSETSVTFIAFLIALPQLVNWRPLRMILFLIFNAGLFVVLVNIYKEDFISSADTFHSTLFTALAIIIYVHICKTKAFNYSYLNKIRTASETDPLTDLHNRIFFKKNLDIYYKRTMEEPLGVFVMDVDNLKYVNDELGHLVEDEIIAGAAKCIKDTFSQYGDCFRVGGDEFCVVVELREITSKELYDRFVESTKSWQGASIDSVSISCGYADNIELQGHTFDRLVSIADSRMYEHKRYVRTTKSSIPL